MDDFLFWRQFYNKVFDSLGFDDEASLHPAKEILCYEANCAALKNPFPRQITRLTNRDLPPSKMRKVYTDEQLQEVANFLQKKDAFRFNALIRGTFDYPEKLLYYDFPLLYYRGDISLLSSPCVAVSGAKILTGQGQELTGNVAFRLVEAGYGIIAGLVQGADDLAQVAAIERGGRCIAVLATPIDQRAKSTSADLQETIARRHLLLSYVPFYRYSQMSWDEGRLYFSDRSKLIASISVATVITDLSRFKKTLSLARETVKQGKPLIFCKAALQAGASWPEEYIREHGAHVAETPEDACRLVEQLCYIG